MSKTRNQCQEPETGNTHYRPPLSTDSNHLPNVGKVGTTYRGLNPSVSNWAGTGLAHLLITMDSSRTYEKNALKTFVTSSSAC